MVERKPSARSRTTSSTAPSKAGSRGGAGRRPAPSRTAQRAPSGSLRAPALAERVGGGRFPATLYLEGPDEALKAALLAELRSAWARACPEAPRARVFRAVESGVEEILAAFHGASLFTPRELLIVLDVEGLIRKERNLRALAEGLARPSGGSCLVLVESASDAVRKSLEPLRGACVARVTAWPLERGELLAWGRRRMARDGIATDPGILETLVESCENDSGEFLNQLEKLAACVGPAGTVTEAEAAALLRPAVGADLEKYLAAVAIGDAPLAARRLGRILASGVGEGSVLFALANLVGGALGGWTRHRDLSAALARRLGPRASAAALDAVYRAEAAWKRGRAEAVAALEQVTRAVTESVPVASR